jgi:ribosomal protein S18 acetylase RimI-like enzyme
MNDSSGSASAGSVSSTRAERGPFTVRALRTDDAANYQALRLRSLREEPNAFEASADEEAKLTVEQVPAQFGFGGDDNDSFVLGAFSDDGSLVGIAGCSRDGPPRRRHRALLWGMYVVPDARGHGIGRALVEETIARVRAWHDVELLRLGVIESNGTARGLYERCGFEAVWREPQAYKTADGYLAVELMRLRIQ